MRLNLIRLLVVEDNRQSADMLRSALDGLGARQVQVAYSARDAYAMAARGSADLLIVDRHLADGDGLELIKRIRSLNSRAAYVPILMLTASADAATVHAARDGGVNEFLIKPFSPRALAERLELMVRRPRPFVRSPDYFGPDRRRQVDRLYTGPERRMSEGRRQPRTELASSS